VRRVAVAVAAVAGIVGATAAPARAGDAGHAPATSATPAAGAATDPGDTTHAAAAPATPPRKPRKPLPPYVPGPPDKAAVAAGEDANLEAAGGRTGIVVAAALGPAILIGISVDHATGTGAGFSFRVGRVANRWTVINLELCGVVFPRTVTHLDAMNNEVSERRINQTGFATIGAQTWVAPTFWLRAAAGVSVFTSRSEGVQFDQTKSTIGGGVVAGAGVDLVRRRSVSLALELLLNSSYYRSGVVLGGGLGLSLGIY